MAITILTAPGSVLDSAAPAWEKYRKENEYNAMCMSTCKCAMDIFFQLYNVHILYMNDLLDSDNKTLISRFINAL